MMIIAEVKYDNDVPYSKRDEWQRQAHPWTVTLIRNDTDAKLTVPYWTGPGITREPTAEMVLESLRSDAWSGGGSFEEFCQESGYNPDSRRAYKTWTSCRETGERLAEFLDGFDVESLIVTATGDLSD